MMRTIILQIVLILSLRVSGQYYFCDSLVATIHQTVFDTEGIRYPVDYINKYYPDQARYFSNRSELNPINLWWTSDSTMHFQNEKHDVRISFSTVQINPREFFYPKDEDEPFSAIREYRAGLPFGVISEDTTVTAISEINVNGNKIPMLYFSDLLNPNRYETMFSIKPIEVYESACGRYLYIYLFGKPNRSIMTFKEGIEFSYMAKLIVSDKGYYVDRIVIPGLILSFFGFGECPYFIGF